MLAVTKALDTYVAPWEGAVRAYNAGAGMTNLFFSFFPRPREAPTTLPPTVTFGIFNVMIGGLYTFKEVHRLKIFDQTILKPLYYVIIGTTFLSTGIVIYNKNEKQPNSFVRICQYPARGTPYVMLITQIAFTIFEFRSRLKQAFLPFLLGGAVALLVTKKTIGSYAQIYEIFNYCWPGVIFYCGDKFEKTLIIAHFAGRYLLGPKNIETPTSK